MKIRLRITPRYELVGAGLVLALTLLIVVVACCSGKDTVAQETVRQPRMRMVESQIHAFNLGSHYILNDTQTGANYLVICESSTGVAVIKLEK